MAKRLSQSKFKELVLHNCQEGVPVIGRLASNREDALVEAMLAHLTEEDRDEVRSYHVVTALEMVEESLSSDYSSDEDSG